MSILPSGKYPALLPKYSFRRPGISFKKPSSSWIIAQHVLPEVGSMGGEVLIRQDEADRFRTGKRVLLLTRYAENVVILANNACTNISSHRREVIVLNPVLSVVPLQIKTRTQFATAQACSPPVAIDTRKLNARNRIQPHFPNISICRWKAVLMRTVFCIRVGSGSVIAICT
jgi:hypothetical protein